MLSDYNDWPYYVCVRVCMRVRSCTHVWFTRWEIGRKEDPVFCTWEWITKCNSWGRAIDLEKFYCFGISFLHEFATRLWPPSRLNSLTHAQTYSISSLSYTKRVTSHCDMFRVCSRQRKNVTHQQPSNSGNKLVSLYY